MESSTSFDQIKQSVSMTEKELKAIFRNGNPADKDKLAIMYGRKEGMENLKNVLNNLRSEKMLSVKIRFVK